MSTSVGFIGLGNMGLPMAPNLIKAGYTEHVHNRTKSRADSLIAQGALWAPTPRAAAQRAPLVFSILADDAALRQVALGDEGVLAGLGPDGVHVDMSTVSPDLSKE